MATVSGGEMASSFRISLAAVLLLAAWSAEATTWATAKARDPISGRSITVQEPVSSGSYIYQWPGKEDQVFWPFTDDAWLRFNPKTGYGAFGEDFEEIEGEALDRVKSWLGANYDKSKPPRTRLEKLAWLEELYEQRGMDDGFRCFFYRLMAFENSEADPATSLEYVRKALPLLQQQLPRAVAVEERLPLLYLLGEYNRRLGNAALAREFFDEARAVTFKDEDGEERVGSEYFNALMDEREALSSGVALLK
jgi:hypothetical protein